MPDARPAAPCLVRRVEATFDLLAVHAASPERYPFFLESAASGTPQARYDILFAFPGETLALSASGAISGRAAPAGGGFLDSFNGWWQELRLPAGAARGLPPFRGGWFVFIGYELAGEIESTLDLPAAPCALPVAFACRIPAALVLDREKGEILLVAEPGEERLLDVMAGDLNRAIAAGAPHFPHLASLEGPLSEEDPEIYLEGVRRVIDYVLAGDVFQVNLSRLWSGNVKPNLSHAAIYDRLRKHNPSPFAGLATLGSRAVISSSPERLVEVEGRIVQTRPIAGTRPRGTSGLTDVALSEELIAHPKERAEHIMLVDLERNDLSRVCVPGSVKVNENMVIESYAQVHHIVSNIRGQLYEDIAPGDVIRAVFPGGTITGCPKVRCMEIIAELERVGRGPYTGSMGYVNRDGGMDLNILIRTLVRDGDSLSLRAGAGIVADSIPDRELEETRAKAGAIVLALVTEN